MQSEMISHPFPPVCAADARVLILGSFPSVRSRETGFYYGHPQNRFWRVVAAVTGEEQPVTVGQKKALLLRNRIALWDSVSSCNIAGSSDASIRRAVPNDVPRLLAETDIKSIFCNGRAAFDCYNKTLLPLTGVEAKLLPSTSAANASWSFEKLVEAWSVIIGDEE